jgi:hypothetical protein
MELKAGMLQTVQIRTVFGHLCPSKVELFKDLGAIGSLKRRTVIRIHSLKRFGVRPFEAFYFLKKGLI